ncbi:4887_t:CDS:1, partial [Ambispora gerdemannii]
NNVSVHITKVANSFLDFSNIEVPPWPAQSFDLNLIDHLLRLKFLNVIHNPQILCNWKGGLRRNLIQYQ